MWWIKFTFEKIREVRTSFSQIVAASAFYLSALKKTVHVISLDLTFTLLYNMPTLTMESDAHILLLDHNIFKQNWSQVS